MIDNLDVVPEIALGVFHEFMHALDRGTTYRPGKAIFNLLFIEQLLIVCLSPQVRK
jgi:hypothetical protein